MRSRPSGPLVFAREPTRVGPGLTDRPSLESWSDQLGEGSAAAAGTIPAVMVTVGHGKQRAAPPLCMDPPRSAIINSGVQILAIWAHCILADTLGYSLTCR
jgi:hypothetical protein